MSLYALLIFFFLTECVSSAEIKPLNGDTTATGSWTTVAHISMEPRQEHGAVKFDDDTIYIIGGIYPEADGIFPTVTIVQKYSVSANAWTSVADLPIPLNHPNSAVVNGKIYVLGGLTTVSSSTNFWNATGACFEYDPTLNIWTTIGELPEGRWTGSAAVGVSGTTVYLAGGLANTNLSNDEEGTISVFTSYNVATKHFAVLPDMPEPRDHAGVGLVNNTLYILGGRAYGHNNTKNTVFSYDLKSNCWSTGLSSMPTARGGCASGVIGTQIFTIGGEGDQDAVSGVFPQNQAYDTATNEWKSYALMDVPRHGTAGVVFGNKVYIPGGGLHEGGLPTNYTSYFQLSRG
ncbi:galactose oxidase [Stipitochalara longipes BDJ]|nr:galactose oxidase [Stipitochalara longipes BDJ]